MEDSNKMRLAVIAFLERRVRELKECMGKERSSNISRFTLDTYLTSKNLLERLKLEQETKAVQAAEDLWHQGF